MKTVRLKMKSYIQPFERELALRELRNLARGEPQVVDLASDEFEVSTTRPPGLLIDRLAYWEGTLSARARTLTPTRQARREATTMVVRNGVSISSIRKRLPFAEDVPLPNRRALRYGPHGIHEYRGKFFPQLVRALLNIGGVSRAALIADPMVGSGTTAVEAVLSNCRALGVDLNPLSVLIARTKCGLLSVDPESLARTYESLRRRILDQVGGLATPKSGYLKTLSGPDLEFVRRWFPEPVLADLDIVATNVAGLRKGAIRDFCWVALSDVLRSVSFQKTDDLRVRRDESIDPDTDAVRAYLDDLGQSVRLVLSFLYQRDLPKSPAFDIREGDARDIATLWKPWREKVDCVVTSPPYATALPYLDTDRLSLVFLGLLARNEHRHRDIEMIGNREITGALRQRYLEEFSSDGQLPSSVVELVRSVHALNEAGSVGFRRHNLSALLARYFKDMQRVLEGTFSVLRPGASAFVVIGSNSTTAGTTPVEIETARLLADIATVVGFEMVDRLSMDMLVSRDIFRRNAIASEDILWLTKPGQK